MSLSFEALVKLTSRPRVSKAELAFWRTLDHPRDDHHEEEKILARSGLWAFLYATQVINRPFPAGERAILRSYRIAYDKFVQKWLAELRLFDQDLTASLGQDPQDR